ncbi:MAG: AraC family transcriptional regulator [Microcoleus sp. PH2017_29_MFU_D_A]|uniref:AraC family transcriptional regulator n=1 Tax=unclassified Microcoleus TaxID=2642155 RepID=UPI001D9BB649|nr:MULTISPECIES: AraC family transcriptional regulator [unclassified Microcoleus]MCC3417988.1 AraC family transcriptional regulator [Microcoleus sp. PH2017_07_MST_O_A]MCC3513491.1 AraC family transcriptional regulator [Microcoleus sp. PH2017_17_BER_D_A]TAE71123.1 MAG: helix-turn-helix domain-containing protein [Oscillatoriales cyanobacterium]MCC3427431.1 AraC family transcriptional regulator [Microcoleus sp. PH2017_01_SCD_O_A]MCC3455443.1 AraC family transcriptional regulator [Microcoleus sp. 
MNVKAFDAYRCRFLKLLEYIDANLEENLSVDKLSIVAAFSKYHFHRQFSEFLGIGVYKYVQLNRLKRASYQLAFRDRPIVDIALTSGYESPEAFARAFKKSIAQTPSEFRKQPQWENWHATYQQLSELRNQHMKSDTSAEQVKIVIFPETKVAALEHRGDPQLIGNSVRKFIEWRQQNNLPPKVSKTFNIVYDNPAETAPEDYRLDICAATDRNIINNSFGVMRKIIPGGRCAVLRYTGSNDNLGAAVRYLYSEWLPQSGEELRDFPLYFERVSLFPDVPESEAITDVFLPLE